MKFVKKIMVCIIFFGILILLINVSANDKGSIIIEKSAKGNSYVLYQILEVSDEGKYKITTNWVKFFQTHQKYLSNSKKNEITILDGETTRYLFINNQDEFINDVLMYIKTLKNVDKEGKVIDDKVAFSNLDFGYYFVYEKENSLVNLCLLTSKDKKITFDNKQYLFTLDVERENSNIGDLTLFTIDMKVPKTDKKELKYAFVDDLGQGLEYDKEIIDFKASIGKKDIDVDVSYKDNKISFIVDMAKYQDNSLEYLTVSYKLRVLEGAISSDAKNIVTLTYKDAENKEKEISVTKQVVSSELKVINQNLNADKELLTKTKYVLQNSDGKYYCAKNTKGELLTNIEEVTDIREVSWVNSEEEATILVMDKKGIVVFRGIADDKYKLIQYGVENSDNKVDDVECVIESYNSEDGLKISHEIIVENQEILTKDSLLTGAVFSAATAFFTVIPIIVYLLSEQISSK